MSTRKSNAILWSVQGLLAALFLFAGGVKLIVPIETLTAGAPVALPGFFLKFIGACEVAGALGLLLPGILRIRKALTPLAAVGLAAIMSGATTITIEGGQAVGAVVPFAVGLLAVLVVRGRSSWARSA
jgi:hypothetical protein